MVETAAVRVGLARAGRLLKRGRAIILAYHNVVPDDLVGMGDASLHLALTEFKRHLDVISDTCQPIPLTDLLTEDEADRSGPPRVVITFDDAYRGAVILACEELADRGMPATIFVAPAILDRTPWWDALADEGRAGLDPTLRAEVLDPGRGTEESARRIAAERGQTWRDMPDLLRTSTLAELREASLRSGVSVGSHTWSHPSLARLDEEGLRDELERSRSWLGSRLGSAVTNVVAYPYGHVSPEVERATAASGYHAGLALERAWVDEPIADSRFRLPRLNVPAGLSANGLSLRLGWS